MLRKLPTNFLTKCLLTFALALLAATPMVVAADPLGATLHKDGTTTFRVWAPFVNEVGVTINGADAVPLTRELGHTDPADTTWTVTVPDTMAGDTYRYAIKFGGVQRKFNDPRAQQLTGFELPEGFGLPGNEDRPESVIIDQDFDMPAFTGPNFNTMVIYELHIGTFNHTFAGAVEKLDYLKNLGVNAVEVLPITQNPLFSDHHPADHDWGYDPVQLFAVKSKYGTPREFKEFVKQCHQRQIAVIVDVVYNHLVGNNLLEKFGGFSNSEIPGGIFLYGGDRANTGFGPRPDYGRPQVRQYITDNALLLLRDYGVDGLRFDDTIDMRTFGPGRAANREGEQLLREINLAYRNTEPKQPGKITIAEDLQSSGAVTQHAGMAALEFSSQWDDSMVNALREIVTRINDGDRNLGSVRDTLQKKVANDVFSRVVYTENHDQVGHPPGQDRLPAMIDLNDPASVFAKKRSTQAAAIMFTAPGIPMIFQGQEMLETRAFGFNTPTDVDFSRADDAKFSGIVLVYCDLIALRRNLAGKTGGLTGQNLNVFHLDDGNKTLAYHRWENGGAGDDVIVVANFANVPQPNLNIGFPRGGLWHVRFNSGANVYDPGFNNGDSFDTNAIPGGKEGMNFNANVGIGAYSVVILSQ
ncbi:MAG TPA: alpha-amylase family glycosyl hydrolase [Planctomycetaceae bacterium]|nr:alpha-amylase family glycosyl hydrolase [Planctomycetaceae bacterium]HQZ66408.1 alpha-amylase family glycosyl hydrolase [Planctomycetaceae bacterium]